MQIEHLITQIERIANIECLTYVIVYNSSIQKYRVAFGDFFTTKPSKTNECLDTLEESVEWLHAELLKLEDTPGD